MSKIKPELISLESVVIYKSNIITSDEFLNKPVDISNILVQYAQDTAFNFDEKAARIRLNINLQGVDEKDIPLGLTAEYGIEFQFFVENFNDFVTEAENQKTLNGQLGTILISIAYSTARGIILERTHNTYFKGAVLPVIDPKGLMSGKFASYSK